MVTRITDKEGNVDWAVPAQDNNALIGVAEVDGRLRNLHWACSKIDQEPRQLIFHFQCEGADLTAESRWRISNGKGPFEHTLTLINNGKSAAVIGLQKSLQWSFPAPKAGGLEQYWVEKAAGRPSPFGFHHLDVGPDHNFTVLSRPYESDKDAYATDWQSRDKVPWTCVYSSNRESGFYAGVEFSGRVSLQVRRLDTDLYDATLGIADEDAGSPEFQSVVRSGERYELPTVFVGCFHGDLDDGCNQMTRWVGRDLRPQNNDRRFPLLNFDSWGSNMGINAESCDAMLPTCSDLGLEQFQIDAGWFRSVGDWRPNPAKFPQGLIPIADKAHALGIKFGLWVGWTQGGLGDQTEDPERTLNVHSPGRADWFADDISDTWKPADYTGANLCLGDPAAADWCESLLDGLVRENKIDMLEHDQQMIVDHCVRTDHVHTSSLGDISYRAALGYYSVYDRLRSKYPNLMFENCVNGGRNVDFGAARRASYFSIVDSYDPCRTARRFTTSAT